MNSLDTALIDWAIPQLLGSVKGKEALTFITPFLQALDSGATLQVAAETTLLSLFPPTS